MDTEGLLFNIQKNDSEQDFATLFHQNYERLFRVAFFYLQNDELPESDNGTLSPSERLEQSELFEVYEKALGELPEKCRAVFMHVKEEGLSYDETAQLCNISAKTVDAQMQKALKHIRSAIEAYMKHGDEQAKRFLSIFL